METERYEEEPNPIAPASESELQSSDAEKAATSTSENTNQHDRGYIRGRRFWLIFSTLAAMVFLVVMEIPIVPASLVAISNDLGGFGSMSWVVSAYLLGRVCVIVIFAKLSDIFGRKLLFSISIAFFVIFSGACGGANTLTQLFVFRAFQGVGGGGAYALSTIILADMVPPEELGTATARLTIVTPLAMLLGPIIGGAISISGNWRWIFYINVPIGGIALIIAQLAIPTGFPYHDQQNRQSNLLKNPPQRDDIRRLDIFGTAILFLATLSLTAGFEEADAQFPWRSAYVISLLSVSFVLWITLVLWERRVTLANGIREPVLPWKFMKNRAMLGILLCFFLLGGPIVVAIYQVPQMFQIVYGFDGLDSGVRVVPFTICWSSGIIIASVVAGRLKVPPVYIILTGACLQIVGFALMSTLPLTLEVPPQIYGYQVIAGLGCGMVLPLLFVMIPFVVGDRDRAVGLGTGSQFQMMGGSVVLAIATSVFNGATRARIEDIIGTTGSNPLVNIGGSLASLSTGAQEDIRLILAEGYNRQMLVLCGTGAAQILFTLLMWKKQQIKI